MKVEVKQGQSLMDVAVQVYGDVQAVYKLAEDNGLEITAQLTPGQLLEVSTDKAMNKAVASFFKRKELYPATSMPEGDSTFDRTFDNAFDNENI